MKRLLPICFILSLVFGGASAFAEPFLCSNPYGPDMVQPTFFEVTVNGGEPMGEAPQVVEGWSRLHMDLADFPDGEYNLEVKACNQWGCSSAVPFSFTKGLPDALTDIFLEF